MRFLYILGFFITLLGLPIGYPSGEHSVRKEKMQVTVPEAARLLRVSERTVRRRLRSGELQGVTRWLAQAGSSGW